jgi:hypothetical protein
MTTKPPDNQPLPPSPYPGDDGLDATTARPRAWCPVELLPELARLDRVADHLLAEDARLKAERAAAEPARRERSAMVAQPVSQPRAAETRISTSKPHLAVIVPRRVAAATLTRPVEG